MSPLSLLFSCFVFLVVSVSASFQKGSLVVLNGLNTESYNERVGMVMEDVYENDEDRLPILIFIEEKMDFEKKAIKKINLFSPTYVFPKERNLAQIMEDFAQTGMLSGVVPEEVPEEIKVKCIILIGKVFEICNYKSSLAIGTTVAAMKTRIIGAYIYLKYGHHATIFAMDYNISFTRKLEYAFDGIGRIMC